MFKSLFLQVESPDNLYSKEYGVSNRGTGVMLRMNTWSSPQTHTDWEVTDFHGHWHISLERGSSDWHPHQQYQRAGFPRAHPLGILNSLLFYFANMVSGKPHRHHFLDIKVI